MRSHDIEWIDDIEPDWGDPLDVDADAVGRYLSTKFGGAAYDEEVFRSGRQVGLIAERSEGFVFGVSPLILLREANGYVLLPRAELPY